MELSRAPQDEAFFWLNEFCYWYFQKRNPEQTMALLSSDFISVGTGEGEVAVSREQFRQLLMMELQVLPMPMDYVIQDFVQYRRAPGTWNCFCNLCISLEEPENNVAVSYRIRMTAAMHQEQNAWQIDALHASEASSNQGQGEFFPLSVALQGIGQINRETQKELMEILVQIMPGGIVGGYIEKGFPLYVANDRMLRMAGYDSFDDFSTHIQGMVINSIHPDDRIFVETVVGQMLAEGDQYEIQYRMKCKDGSDLWIHDIGRKTMTDDGREAIISVLVDVSEQVSTNKNLQKEANKDPLTDLYNRKAGQSRIESAMQSGREGYLFVLMDLDNFKQVNDCYGHQQGDRALYELSNLLIHTFRRTDILFRLGGDEFGMFFSTPQDIGKLEQKLEGLIQAYQILSDENWPRAMSSLSIGGIYGRRVLDFSELYRLADEVLYQVKKECKGSVRIRPI